MTLKIIVHDVGHGHAIHVFTPNGHVIVIDLGCDEDFSPLEWLGGHTKTIDSLVISHPHGDHIDEIQLIKSLGFRVRQLWRPKWLQEADVRKANQKTYVEKLDTYFAMNSEFSHAISSGELVGSPEVSGGVSVEKFASNTCGVSNINNHSGVVVVTYEGVKVVIPGDNEPPSWNVLLEQPAFVEATRGAHVYLASHHGRASGYLPDLFKVITPKLCLVSDGRVQETDVTSRYSGHAQGWDVQSRSLGQAKTRKCVTTRTDGHVVIEVGRNSGANAYLSVSTN